MDCCESVFEWHGEQEKQPGYRCVCVRVHALMHLQPSCVCVCVCVCVYGSVQMWSDVFFSFTKGATSGHPVSLQHKQSYFWAHLSWSLQFWRGKSKVSLLTLPIFYFFKSNLHTLMLLGLVIAILCLFNSAHTLIWMKRIFLLDTFSFWVHGFKLAWFYQLFRNYGFSNNLKSNRTISSKS